MKTIQQSKKHIFPLIIALIFYIVTFGGGALTAYAEDAADPMGGFNYKVIKPENQRSEAGYFDLRMNPGQKQTVQVELTNGSSNEITVAVSLNGAKTNGNGVVEYGPTAIKNDASLKYDFTKIVTGPDKVVIPAGKTVPLELNIAMPEVGYDGVVAGGVQLKKVVKEDKNKTGVINEYAYLIGMILNETDTAVEPDLKMNKVSAGLANYRNSIFVNFSNVTATYVEGMTVDTQIMPEKSDEVLYDSKKAGMRMAPNSMIDFPIEMNGEKMVPGNYRAHVLVTAGDKRWEWDEKFTITDEEADKFNGQDVGLVQERGIDWRLIIGIAAALLVVVVVIFVIVRQVQKKNLKKKRKQKKRPATKPKK